MTANSNVTASGLDHAIHHPVAALVGIFAKIGNGLSTMTKSMQHARMISALNSLTDHQLSEVGIKRSEIADYANKLMANE
ncbi:DUF1127 domain-containing protein [Planktotalea sp.]|uniref:DUF1127 domain-containing protein n=1 Tax=Planktotalea sp. TaxID=2029877 RepID=UPI0032980DC4